MFGAVCVAGLFVCPEPGLPAECLPTVWGGENGFAELVGADDIALNATRRAMSPAPAGPGAHTGDAAVRTETAGESGR